MLTAQEYAVVTVATVGLILISVRLMVFTDTIHLSTENKKDMLWKMPKIKDGKPTKWGWVVRHPEKFILKENTDIGFGTYIQAKYGVTIGKNVKIGAHCSIYSENTIDNTHGEIVIEDNVSIGAGTVILPINSGVLYIRHDSKIGAMSLIKSHIPSNCIAYGISAKVVSDSNG